MKTKVLQFSLLFVAILILSGCSNPEPSKLQPPARPILQNPKVEQKPVGEIMKEAVIMKELGVKSPMIKLPSVSISKASYKLLLDFEVGGGKSYYDKLLSKPTYPGAQSGVTVGVGYDCGYNSKAVIIEDWSELQSDWIRRLADTAGVTGSRAKSLIPGLRDIRIDWSISEKVFQNTTITKFYLLTKRTYPGFDDLNEDAQGGLVSVVFNRGNSLVGARRIQMKNIKPLVAKKDYAGIAGEIEDMIPIWAGQDIYQGMKRRRLAEAKLVRTPLSQ